MKKLTYFVMAVILLVSSIAFADAKADGYSFAPDENFKPGVYVAVRDAKAFSDADVSSPWKKGNVKKGTKSRSRAAATMPLTRRVCG